MTTNRKETYKSEARKSTGKKEKLQGIGKKVQGLKIGYSTKLKNGR